MSGGYGGGQPDKVDIELQGRLDKKEAHEVGLSGVEPIFIIQLKEKPKKSPASGPAQSEQSAVQGKEIEAK